jgi:hypothetical protein
MKMQLLSSSARFVSVDTFGLYGKTMGMTKELAQDIQVSSFAMLGHMTQQQQHPPNKNKNKKPRGANSNTNSRLPALLVLLSLERELEV